jgi:hypothetical protein
MDTGQSFDQELDRQELRASEASRKFKPNKAFLISLFLLFFCEGMHSSYTVGVTYRLFDFMKYHFGWTTAKEIAFYNAIYA